jgi:acetoin:2,6-dichlorophenolindophenol oxidoreductase subunit beta
MTDVQTKSVTENSTPRRIVHALNSGLDNALARDRKVLLLGEDIADPAGGVYKVTKGLSTKYGNERVRATPIAETSIVGAAIGAALAGYRPVAEVMYFDFVTVCMDQLVNHAAKLRYMSAGATPVPITIRTTVGSNRFGAQHAQSLEAWFMHVPGLKVVMASNPVDAKGLLLSAIFDDDPCLFIEHNDLLFKQKQDVPDDAYFTPLGKAATPRPGDDVTIVTYGAMVPRALQAAEQLATSGISAEVIDLRSLLPLDMDTVLESVARTRRLIILHSATQFAGPGAEVSAQVNEQLFGELSAPIIRLGMPFTPIPFSPELDQTPTVDDVVAAANRLTGS